MRTPTFKSLLAAGAAWLAMAPAAGAIDSVAKEVLGFNDSVFILDPRSGDCGIKKADLTKYATHMANKMKGLGLSEGPDYPGTLVGRVYTQRLAGIAERCFVRVEMNLVAALSFEEIEIKASKKKQGRIKAYLRSVKTFPIIGYQSDILYVNPAAGVAFSVTSRIDRLVDKFKAQRTR